MFDAGNWLLDAGFQNGRGPMSYKKLVIWQKSREFVLDIHRMILNKSLYSSGGKGT